MMFPRGNKESCHRSCKIDHKLRMPVLRFHRPSTATVRVSNLVPDGPNALYDSLAITENSFEEFFMLAGESSSALAVRLQFRKISVVWIVRIEVIEDVFAHCLDE
jgi:hypothetical protein